jgi:hypothetical protein
MSEASDGFKHCVYILAGDRREHLAQFKEQFAPFKEQSAPSRELLALLREQFAQFRGHLAAGRTISCTS